MTIHAPEPVKAVYRFVRDTSVRASATGLRHVMAWRGDTRVIVFLGMRRSGNHLVINWIKKQSDGPFVFYNNIKLHEEPLQRHKREVRVGGLGPSRMLLSYEDLTPEPVLESRVGEVLRRYAGDRPGAATVVAILRDPYNLFASRSQRWQDRLRDPEQRAEWRALYHRFADLFLDGALPDGAVRNGAWTAGRLPLVTISYNEFVMSRPYREEIARALGLTFTDRGLDEVPHYGWGSSFDGFAQSGARLEVFDRWRRWQDDADFRDLLDDPALLEKAGRIFGQYMPAGLS